MVGLPGVGVVAGGLDGARAAARDARRGARQLRAAAEARPRPAAVAAARPQLRVRS